MPAELLLASLRDAGCGELVVSPGSRSTPLVLAAARLGLACEVVIDERVAGFVALGRARATRRPAALVCTSDAHTVHGAIGLAIPCQSLAPDVHPARDRAIEYAGEHASSLPLDQCAGGNVDGNDAHAGQDS